MSTPRFKMYCGPRAARLHRRALTTEIEDSLPSGCLEDIHE